MASDLVLTGHSHTYERSHLIDGHYGFSETFSEAMKVDPGDGAETGDGAYQKSGTIGAPHEGTVYAVAGASGRAGVGGILDAIDFGLLEPSLDHPTMVVNRKELGSMVLDIYGNRLDAKYLETDGRITDDFTILKGPDITFS